ncbi:N-acetylneuraminate synthase [Leeuwenhoekiella aequorea]|uniref:N-acetylneuraminate synthase n=1 Tax=Leeuwenhoekiella aequorea TaxID=283736 RepID=UPI00352EA6CA|tara:strand:- start:13063 stop:14076 length:1014 start_codon:yes stop_codon:yes gene_type:complete
MSRSVIIIAEAGVNHNGNVETAKKLIDAAARAKVDYVKFQTFKAKNIVTKSALRAKYQNDNTKNNDSQYEMLKKLELSKDLHLELIQYANSKNVNFLSTAFDLESLKFLKSLDLEVAKIPSGEITNLPYLRMVAQLFENIIMSTGMATIAEIKAAYEVLIDNGARSRNITILHCNTEYPTPMEDVNLLAMLNIKSLLSTSVGYSDHTLGIEVPIAAVALGATVIEKHFTLDRNMKGPDHRASLEPEELYEMVKGIRNIEKAIAGSGLKEPSKSELKNKEIARKSIVASRDIEKGEIFTEFNVAVKRPGGGISPMKWDEIIGQKATFPIKSDEFIQLK